MNPTTNEVIHTYTLEQFIKMSDAEKITYQRYSILERSRTNKNLIYSIDNLLYTYIDELKAKRKRVRVSPEEKIKYIYKPKLLSYDIYGSLELYFVILALNGMCNVKEFDLMDNIFYALSPADMNDMLNSIKIAEQQYINLNRSTLQIYE